MPTSKNSAEIVLSLRRWREQRRSQIDADLHQQFCSRAAEVREQVVFLLAGGLSDGAGESLATIAEQDMLDFDILVDLAGDVRIAGIAPLTPSERQHLTEFLSREPWITLSTDHDITVALAMIGAIAFDAERRPWYEIAPDLYRVLAEVMDRVDLEQYQRFVEELKIRVGEFGFELPKVTSEHINQVLLAGARRVGAKPPTDLFSRN